MSSVDMDVSRADSLAQKAALAKLQEDDETVHPFLKLCRKYATNPDPDVATELHQWLQTDGNLGGTFKDMLKEDDLDSQQRSIEGLAYTSFKPTVKEELASDKEILAKLVHLFRTSSNKAAVRFGVLTVLVNVTKYLPVLSEEQKHLSQLKAYANTSKAKIEADPLESDERVTARCKAILDSNVVSALTSLPRDTSIRAIALAVVLLQSLSKEQKHRGVLAQQGAVKFLLQTHESTSDEQVRRTAAHALARILISINPYLIFGFSSASPSASAIRPLLSLLEDDPTTDHRDLLPTFEALLALTNLASTGSDDNQRSIIQHGWPAIEDLLFLSQNPLVQRAATELVCNLMTSPDGIAKFADHTPAAANRLHLLLALADVDDPATRRAASGALAMLTEHDAVVEAILARDRGVPILLDLCGDDDNTNDDALRHRGIACVANLLNASDDQLRRRAVDRVRTEGGVQVLTQLVRRSTTNQDILDLGHEALKSLTDA